MLYLRLRGLLLLLLQRWWLRLPTLRRRFFITKVGLLQIQLKRELPWGEFISWNFLHLRVLQINIQPSASPLSIFLLQIRSPRHVHLRIQSFLIRIRVGGAISIRR
jgi:hypothetical protein